MISPELLAQIRRIQLKARHLISDMMSGEYASAFRGQGMEFDEVREYLPGDDVRSIDWNVTARMNAPFVKIFREERELTMMILVDVSGSQLFGTTQKSKLELSAEIAAILAFLAIKNHDKVGLVLFSDHIECFIPPKKGRAHVWNLVRSVLIHEARGHATNLNEAFKFLLNTMKRRTLCFVISDFWDQGFRNTLAQIARRHDLVAILTTDPREKEIPKVGLVRFQDLETGQTLTYDTSSVSHIERLRQTFNAHEAELIEDFKRFGIDHITVATDNPPGPKILNLIRQREKRGRA